MVGGGSIVAIESRGWCTHAGSSSRSGTPFCALKEELDKKVCMYVGVPAFAVEEYEVVWYLFWFTLKHSREYISYSGDRRRDHS